MQSTRIHAANVHAQGSEWLVMLEPKNYSLVKGNQSIVWFKEFQIPDPMPGVRLLLPNHMQIPSTGDKKWKDKKTPNKQTKTKTYTDVPAKPKKFDFLYVPIFPKKTHPSVYISDKKHQILPKLIAFYDNLLIFEFWCLHLWLKDTHLYNKFGKKSMSKGRNIILFLIQCTCFGF